MEAEPILLTGGGGQIGQAVLHLAAEKGINIFAPSRSTLNLEDEGSIVSLLAHRRWAAVINCAAFTAVDLAEKESELAEKINAIAPAIFARETAKFDIPMIQVSTDYVFDGTKEIPYFETDPVNPLGVYGRTKELGESAVRVLNPRHAIIRTAWVVSAVGTNFINTMIRLASERSSISVVDDQIGCPSSASDIAKTLLAVAEQMDSQFGTWHFVNSGEASWYDLAVRIFATMERRGLSTPILNAISTSQYPTAAQRPCNSRLSTTAIQRDFGLEPRHWHEAIDAILAERLQD